MAVRAGRRSIRSGQRVGQALFSPDFAADQTLIISAVSGDFPANTLASDKPTDQAATDNERSLGILASLNGGDSWTALSAGLEIDGVPYRHVQRLAISPRFGTDATLFVFAWGPRLPVAYDQGRVRDWRGALFRSRDRGTSWQAVLSLGGDGEIGRSWASLGLSPTFDADGIALLAQAAGGFTPHGGCRVWRTADWGLTWDVQLGFGQLEGCDDVQMYNSGGGEPNALLVARLSGPILRRSPDGGRTWERFAPPAAWRSIHSSTSWCPPSCLVRPCSSGAASAGSGHSASLPHRPTVDCPARRRRAKASGASGKPRRGSAPGSAARSGPNSRSNYANGR